ncbi:hypothetical protein ACTGVN_09250 [Streptococcus suis]
MQIKVTLLDQWQYGQPQKIKTLQSLSLADCGKAREIPQIKKGTNLKYFTVQNPIAVWVEGKIKKPAHLY